MYVGKILLISAILVGCSTTEPTIKVVTQEVKIPVAVPCKEELPIEPDYCFPALTESSDIFEKVRCLLSDKSKSKAYEIELISKLKACK